MGTPSLSFLPDMILGVEGEFSYEKQGDGGRVTNALGSYDTAKQRSFFDGSFVPISRDV